VLIREEDEQKPSTWMILFWILFTVNTVGIVVFFVLKCCKRANKIKPQLNKSETVAAEDIETQRNALVMFT
jgi:uncharacterized protein YpmS